MPPPRRLHPLLHRWYASVAPVLLPRPPCLPHCPGSTLRRLIAPLSMPHPPPPPHPPPHLIAREHDRAVTASSYRRRSRCTRVPPSRSTLRRRDSPACFAGPLCSCCSRCALTTCCTAVACIAGCPSRPPRSPLLCGPPTASAPRTRTTHTLKPRRPHQCSSKQGRHTLSSTSSWPTTVTSCRAPFPAGRWHSPASDCPSSRRRSSASRCCPPACCCCALPSCC
mmetsp:Transcript_16650/g.42595  ORF Transcript_16650/g.42595 Transcript_16650/m.42595 type:complete len:224 (-) Transcript_16650:597-1268(-)